MDRKNPLYRSVNTRSRGVFHASGGDYRWSRRRVDRVHDGAEVVARLDRAEPILWMVARSDAEKSPFVLIGENTYYSGLFVDADNRLRLIDPDLHVEHMEPGCACCTHTFNGVPFTRKYDPSAG